jgi:hypothetical protein
VDAAQASPGRFAPDPQRVRADWDQFTAQGIGDPGIRLERDSAA